MATDRIALTDARLRNLEPRDVEYEVRDAGAPGLRLRVYPSGLKVWRWLGKRDGKNVVDRLGVYPTMTLKMAREELERVKARHKAVLLGELSQEAAMETVAELAEVFYARRIVPHRRCPKDVRKILDQHILPAIGKRKLTSLTTPACSSVVLAVVNKGFAGRAGKVLAILKQMLDFAASNGAIMANPAYPLRAENLGVVANVRNRTLTGEEIAALYRALEDHRRLSIQTKVALKILLLTGVRTGELLAAKWANVDLVAATWTLPVEDQKLTLKAEAKAQPFVVPLAPQALELFRQAKTFAGTSPFVMGSDASKTGRLNDRVLGLAVRRLFSYGKLTMPPFSPHDLRRTCRTWLGKLKVAPHIAERCLNHSLGKIVETYDTGDYLDERREALTRWADHVDILTGEAGNVVALRRAG